MNELLKNTAERASRYLENVREQRAYPAPEAIQNLAAFDEPLPENPTDPEDTIRLLDEAGSPATVASTGGRYFGFVTGGTLPASLAANWLAGTWDQNAFGITGSPVTSKVEEVALKWLVDVLKLPVGTGAGFVTGATMANFTALAAARHVLLERVGWDVEAKGLFGAPEIKVVVGDEVHISLLKALGMLGLGRERVIRVPVDRQGRIRPEALPELDDMTIMCIQAGNVNAGAFDPATVICAAAKASNAWVHVDGAFGLWAAASPNRAYLVEGVSEADSWATDAHKWLNVPYDSGLAFCRNPEQLRGAMLAMASYLVLNEGREPDHFTPELSRRARGMEIWAALRSLGRAGLADMIERNCRYATRFAEGLSAAGYQILNEVVLNQVVVSFGDAEKTKKAITAIQNEGTCWAGSTVWQGHTAMRISVSSWATTEDDVERSLDAIIRTTKSIL